MKSKLLKKIIIAGCLTIGLVLGGTSATIDTLAATKQCTTYDGDNVGDQNYSVWSDTVKSYLSVCTDGSLMRVQSGAVDSGILVEYYDSGYNFKSKKIVSDGMLPIFGGFYAYGSYYYVLSGQTNYDENDAVEVYRITKYDQSWNVVGYDGIYGANTYIPFDAGSARMTASGNYLLVRTCHEMYQSSDGYHHQANVTIQFDINTMKITDSYTGVMNSGYGYVSHSFNQFIRTDGTSIVGVDHGDAHPRSVCLIKYNTDFTGGSFVPNYYTQCNVANMVSLSGDIGVNATGASVGGFELSANNYIVVGNSINQASQSNTTRNIFVSVVPRDLSGSIVAKYITDFAEKETSVSTPHLVKINDNRFMILWTKDGKVYYTEIDGNGKLVRPTYSMTGELSDCLPVLYNNKLVWYVWNNEKVDFYSIDVNTPSTNSVTNIINGHDYNVSYANGNNNVASQVCKVCGYKEQFTTPKKLGSVFWRRNADTGSYYCNDYASTFDVGDTLDLWHYYSGTEANKEFEVLVSDPAIASYTSSSNNMGRFKMLKAGSVKVTIRAKYNPSVKNEYTIKVEHTYSDEILKKATCVSEGLVKRTCTGCGFVTQESIDKSSHVYSEWTITKAPTYKDTGLQTHKCKNCGRIDSRTISRRSLDKVKLSTPANMSNGIKLKWSQVTGAEGYYIYRKTGSGKYSRLATIKGGSKKTYLDKTAVNGSSYTYKLLAYAGTNKSKSSTIKTVYITSPKLSSISSKKPGSVTAVWKKNSKASGYQLQYSVSSSFKGAKSVAIKSNKTLKTTISKLKKGKKYYVRMRAYKKVSGKNYYSAWSTKKKITVRK